jgi:tRNA(Ile)-lysidine synthase TilS/MesJ
MLDDRDIAVIRPLVLTEEREIRRAVKRNGLPVVKSACPADGHTNRERTKSLLAQLERDDHGLKDRLFGAMVRGDVDGWGIK